MITGFRYFIYINWRASQRFFNEGYTYRASAFTYTTVLSLVPLLCVVLFVVALFPSAQHIFILGQNYILDNFVPKSAIAIEPYLQSFINQSLHLPTVSILFLVVTTIMLVHSIEETMNEIWHVPMRKHGYKILSLIIHSSVFLLIPFLIGWSIFLSSYVFFLGWLIGTPDNFIHFFVKLLPIIINTFVLTTLYVAVPNIKMTLKDGLLGGFVAALLFEISRILFAYYVGQFSNYSAVYGAFGIVPIFLIWLYIFWSIILYCALLIEAKVHKEKQLKRPTAS